MRRPVSYLLFFCLCGILDATPPKWTEHRRALLVHIGDDKAHAETIKKLEKKLQSKGFVTKLIGVNIKKKRIAKIIGLTIIPSK